MDPNLWLWTAGRTWGLRWGFGSFAAAAARSVLRWSPEKDKSQDVRFPKHPWPAKCIPALYRCLVYNVTVLRVDNLFSLFVHLIDIYIYTLYTRGVWEDWFSQWLSCTLWFWVCLPKSPIDIYIIYLRSLGRLIQSVIVMYFVILIILGMFTKISQKCLQLVNYIILATVSSQLLSWTLFSVSTITLKLVKASV